MFNNNPFSNLAEIVPPLVMQGFVIVMVGLVILGTLIDILHKKNVKYFFDNAKKAKKNAFFLFFLIFCDICALVLSGLFGPAI